LHEYCYASEKLPKVSIACDENANIDCLVHYKFSAKYDSDKFSFEMDLSQLQIEV